ncbi:MAG: hypothetical protein V4671_05415 [Armatimonadota bacterium]
MRLLSVVPSLALLVLAAPLHGFAPPPPPAPAAPVAPAPAPAQVRLDMRLSRINKEGPGTADSSAGTGAASPTAPLIASPTLSALDRGTATVSITNKDLSYSLSASPSIEQAGKADSAVQVLWNLRLSGRSLPEGTNAATTTGATRVSPGAPEETLLTELPISDPKTGNVMLFRLTVRVTVTKAASPVP